VNPFVKEFKLNSEIFSTEELNEQYLTDAELTVITTKS
jgi:hypothetical protein